MLSEASEVRTFTDTGAVADCGLAESCFFCVFGGGAESGGGGLPEGLELCCGFQPHVCVMMFINGCVAAAEASVTQHPDTRVCL